MLVPTFFFYDCTELTEPPNRLPLDPVSFWVIIGVAAAVFLVLVLSLLIVCCYCICKKARRKRYVFETGIAI